LLVANGGRCLWIDASAGASGDMLLGALLDAGAPIEAVAAAVAALGVEPIEIRPLPVRRHGLRATKAEVHVNDTAASRSLGEVMGLVAAAALPPSVAALAHEVLGLLGGAEAAVHGEDVEKIHLHEAGALDSLADVVGCAAALDALGLLDPRARVVVGSVALGSGTVATAHGLLPVPVPAVLAILAGRGAPVVAGGEGELCTPTGAALLATLAAEWGPLPAMRIDAVGVGAGTADPRERANVLRVVLGSAAAPAAEPWRNDDLFELEATVDDLDPRLWPAVLDSLVEAGAADAWLTPVVMRKGRPGNVVTALVAGESIDAAARALFAGSTTLGVRLNPIVRRALPRDVVVVRVDGGEVRVKRGFLDGEAVTAQAEYADAALVASRLGIPVRAVLERAVALARSGKPEVAAAEPSAPEPGPRPEKGAQP
jgi:hypothetical protein